MIRSNTQTNNNNKKKKNNGKKEIRRWKQRAIILFNLTFSVQKLQTKKPSRNLLSYWRMTLTRMWRTEEFFLTEWPIQGSLLAELDLTSEDK